VDPRTFDGMVQRLAGARTRRSVMAGSLLAVLGFGEAALAKHRPKGHTHRDTRRGDKAKKTGTVTVQSRLNINEQCPKKKRGKKLSCNDCRTGFSVAYINDKGKTVRKCACKPVGEGCTTGTAANCCSGVCGEDGTCVSPLAPGQTCSALGVSCTSNAQCCNGICNVGGSNIGPLDLPNPGTANTCAHCLTGGATCEPNDAGPRCCYGGCFDLDGTPGGTAICCSRTGETCMPLESTATVPDRGTCCSAGNLCPVAGGVGTANVCCKASGTFTPLDALCGVDGNSGQGCCSGQCSSLNDRCCAPAGADPTLSGGNPCTGTEANDSCCSGNCAAAGICA
jgi:hypothetical protein